MTRRLPLPQPRSRPPLGSKARACLAFSGLFAAALVSSVHGQEIPRPSYARQKAKVVEPSMGNFRVGEVILRVDASLQTEFVDNVDLSKVAKADVIVTPQIGISAIWAVTKMNTLRLRSSLGYIYYFNNPNLNRQQMTISPDSALSFDMFIGDVKINLHNQFSLTQEAVSQGTLSGVAQLERFTNTMGLSILWDTNDIVWTLGYDHYTFITLGGANSSSGTVAASLSNYDHSTDQISGSVAVKMNSALIGGIETTAFYSEYPDRSESNYSGLSGGAYFELQVTKYTHMFLNGGMKGYFSGEAAPGSVAVDSTTAAQPSSGDPTGYYASMSFVHRLNRFYSDRLDLGHTDEIDAIGGHTLTNYVRYNANWRVNSRFILGLGLFFEDVTIAAGSALGGTVASDYRRYGASLSTGLQVSDHFNLGLSYDFLNKIAERPSESYTRNRFTISLGYRF